MFNLTDYESFKAYLFLHQDIKNATEANVVIKELEGEKANWGKAMALSKVDDYYPQIYITLADAYFKIRDFQKAIDYLQQITNELESNKDFQYYFEYRSLAYDLLAKCYCYLDSGNDALPYMRKSVFNNMKIFCRTRYDKFDFYSFRGVSEYSLADLSNNTVTLSDPTTFNDPVDTALFPNLLLKIDEEKNPCEKLYHEVMYKAYANIRIRCFVRNLHLPEKEGRDAVKPEEEYNNTLMWSHYADYHKGFCIKYVFPSNILEHTNPNLIYQFMEMDYVESLNPNKDLNFKEAFFTKNKAWEYEHEKRLLFYDVNESQKFVVQKIPAGCIKEVYLGLKCNLEDQYKIKKALKADPNIKVFRMVLSRDNLYKIRSYEINWNEIPAPPTKKQKKENCCRRILRFIDKRINLYLNK